MNKKGFTVVELLTTFVLISIVATLLISLSISLSKMYENTSTKTQLYYKQSIISKDLNESFLLKSVSQITNCGDKCLMVVYTDGSSKRIQIENTVITIGDNVYDIVKNSTIGNVNIDLIYSPLPQSYKADTILNIKIPITYKGGDSDFGINFVYQFNRQLVSVSL